MVERDDYDSVPYVSSIYAHTHPDRLCMLGRLFGLEPTPPTSCRVLELGCASGLNVAAMAELLPGSEFVGIDRSQVQIDEGRSLIARLGLTNLRLERADLSTLDPQTLGTFDYVVCHGVFSWVSRSVQDRILSLTAELLRPRGLAYVSYNVYPGWHLREQVRHMMRFHLRRFDEPEAQLEQARALLEFTTYAAAQTLGEDNLHARLLDRELSKIQRMPDAYLFHEQLEHHNIPLYFHEFIERLAELPLRYLCDSNLPLTVASDIPREVLETFARVADDVLALEQYLDFVRNRQFRTSVLCRAEAQPPRRIVPTIVAGLRLGFAGALRDGEARLESGVELCFVDDAGGELRSSDPLTKAALLVLVEVWPATVPFAELFERAVARVGDAGVERDELGEARDALAADLVECLLRGSVVARTWEPPLATTIPARPRLTSLSRLLADREGWMVTLHHQRGQLDEPMRKLAALLDGSRDRAALLADLDALLEPDERDVGLESLLERLLARLVRLPAVLDESVVLGPSLSPASE